MTLASLHPLHPLMAHFPIALLITAFAFDLVGMLWRREALWSAGFYTQILGAVGAIGAVVTGNQAEETVERLAGIEETLELHERLGQISMWAALVAVTLRWYLTRRQPIGPRMRPVILAVSLGLAIMVGVSGWFGGELVYGFGAGVAPVMRTLGPEGSP